MAKEAVSMWEMSFARVFRSKLGMNEVTSTRVGDAWYRYGLVFSYPVQMRQFSLWDWTNQLALVEGH